MNDNLDLEENKGLPTFLKVLCILTFIGAGIGFLSALYGMFTTETAIKSLENSQELMRNSHLGDLSGQIEAMKKWGVISNILNFAGNGLCLIGALMMWKLKKVGFFLYVGGHATALVSSFLMMDTSNSSSNMMSLMTTVAMIIAVIFTAAFIIMYAVNYKHLKN
ncbi:MAG: hypothetical protein V4622_10375 [Bacteroidota bacterium]